MILSAGQIDLFADTAAILISIVSNSYYGMPRGQIQINLPPEHPIMSFETIENKMAAVSAKRSMILHVIRYSTAERSDMEKPRQVLKTKDLPALVKTSFYFF